MSQKTQEILNNYFIQKEAGMKMKLLRGLVKGKHAANAAKDAAKSGIAKTVSAVKAGGNKALNAAKAADAAVVRGAEAASDKLARLSFKGLPADKYVTDSAPRLAAYRLSNHILHNPRAYGYGAIGAGLAIPAVAGGAALAGGDKGILANAMQLAKDNPLTTAGIVGGGFGASAAAIAYALAPEKTKKLAATIAGLGGFAAAGAGTYAGLKA